MSRVRNANDLPSTYIDWVRRVRPYLPRRVKEQAGSMIEKGLASDIDSVDDLGPDNMLEELWETELRQDAKRNAARFRATEDEVYWHIKNRRPDVAKMYLGVVEMDYHLLLRHFLAGEKLFYFLPGISNRLLHTDMRVPVEALQLPFKSMALVFDTPEVVDAFYDVTKERPAKAKGAITVFVSTLMREGERRLSFTAAQTHGENCHLILQRSLLLRSGWDTERALRTNWEELGNPPDRRWDDTAFEGAITGDESVFYTDGLRFFRLVLNALLYLSSHRPVTSPPRKNGAYAREDKLNYSMDSHVLVGEGITPIAAPGENGVRLPDGSIAAVATADRKVTRVLVMGHWKQQVHGPGKSLRKLIHVEPYWRGPEMADAVSRPHVVH